MRQNGDLTYEQIAEIRSSPVGTVKTQMRAALQKLRKSVELNIRARRAARREAQLALRRLENVRPRTLSSHDARNLSAFLSPSRR